MFIEYLTNMYILPFCATLIGLGIVFIYDKFEKKQYTNSIYLRIGILIYISCLATIYLSKSDFLQNGGNINSSIEIDQQSLLPKPNNIKTHIEQFKTGTPTF